jgi:UDP-N-acetyl-D-glucosamine dehydrogenase
METPKTALKELNWKSLLLEAIATRHFKIGVVDLGHIGLSLAAELAQAGFEVTGVDPDPVKVETIQIGRSYLANVPSSWVAEVVAAGKLKATTCFESLNSMDVIHLSISRSPGKTRHADPSNIFRVIEEVIPNIRHGQLIVMENSTYPGTDDEVLIPALQKAGFEIGKDLFLVHSPLIKEGQRNLKFKPKGVPKIVGGFTSHCADVAQKYYEQFGLMVVPVSSPETAEMVRLLEKTFQRVGSAVVNELALLCDRMGIDVWEVIKTARINRLAFMDSYPEPGLGGAAAYWDEPVYLPSKMNGVSLKFFDLAKQINSSMPDYIVSRITRLLNERKTCLLGSKILIIGISGEKKVDDTQELPSLEVIDLLLQRGMDVEFYDPYIQQFTLGGKNFQRTGLESKVIQACEVVVILNHHPKIDYGRIIRFGKLVFDIRNVTLKFNAPNVVRL